MMNKERKTGFTQLRQCIYAGQTKEIS